MKKMKGILALILAAILVCGLFAACAKQETPKQEEPTQQQTATTPKEDTKKDEEPAKTEEPEKTDEPETIDPDDVEELVMYYYDFRNKVEVSQHVEDAVNEILVPAIGVKLDIKWLGIGNWLNTFTLDMAGGEQLDIINIMPATTLEGMYSNNQLVDLTELVPEYAPQTYELMKDYMGPFYVDGRLYGIPTNKNFRVDGYLVMNKEMLEEIGMLDEAKNCSSWSEYEAIAQKIKEYYNGEVYASEAGFTNPSWLPNGDSFADVRCNDFLGAQYYVATDDDGHVSLLQGTDGYKQSIQMAKKWLDNGWLDPELATAERTHATEMLKARQGFSTNVTAEYGVEVAQGGNLGYEVVCPKFFDGVIRTNNVNSWGAGVTVNTVDEVLAVKTLEYIYNSPEVMNLLNWGVEGVDYELEDGLVKRIGDNPYFEHDAFFGNNLIMTPLAGNEPDFYQIAQKINDESVKSPYLGFAIDPTGLDNVIANMSAVYDQYHGQLTSGYYTEELYQEYLNKLEVAGVNDYLAEIQDQLNSWLAAQ